MEHTEQSRLVLNVLTSMKYCIDRNDTYTKDFNLHRWHGICWHVHAYTPSTEVTGIDYDFLKPIFDEMGLDQNYPIEMQMVDNVVDAGLLYNIESNLYDLDKVQGQLRYKLLCDLIEYFNKVL